LVFSSMDSGEPGIKQQKRLSSSNVSSMS
jgi:hypothetical protein